MNQQAVDKLKAQRDAAIRERDDWKHTASELSRGCTSIATERDALKVENQRLREENRAHAKHMDRKLAALKVKA